MAYLQDDQLDEEQRRQLADGAPASTTGSTVGTATASPAPTSSGQFTDLRAYLEANKDQGKAMATDLANRVGGQVSKAQTEENQARGEWTRNAQNQVNDWAQNNRSEYDRWLAGQRSTLSNATTDYRDAMQRAGSRGPMGGFGQMEGLTSNYNVLRDQLLGQTYSPTEKPTIDPYTQDTTSEQAAQDRINALGTQTGREAALQEIYGGTNTPGGNRLDAAILGAANPNIGSDIANQYAPILEALTGRPAPKEPTALPGTYETLGQVTAREDAARQAADEARRVEAMRQAWEQRRRDLEEREPRGGK